MEQYVIECEDDCKTNVLVTNNHELHVHEEADSL